MGEDNVIEAIVDKVEESERIERAKFRNIEGNWVVDNSILIANALTRDFPKLTKEELIVKSICIFYKKYKSKINR